ncbi:MAG TPA: threonine--tRNA ligase [Deltaproteobacteria bacterium]|nr:threonine--tRNA ligase [Deltaproteobacteria bacterium]
MQEVNGSKPFVPTKIKQSNLTGELKTQKKQIIVKKGESTREIIKDPNVIAIEVGEKQFDISTVFQEDTVVLPIYLESEKGRQIERHSASHIMAQAIKSLYKDAHFGVGPAIRNGFYYDFDINKKLKLEDLEAISEKMSEIVKKRYPFVRKELSKQEAIEYFKDQNDYYKVEILESITDERVSLYQQGDFVDLCRGPHLPNTGYLKAFKLLSVAGAYFKGDEKNKMLQRIYGTAFENRKKLIEYLNYLEEIKKRDHRKLGKELDLFSITDEVGPGLIIWHPKGAMLRYLLEEFERTEHLKHGYEFVKGPEILRTALWKKSGHYDNYRENMYFTEVEEQSFGIKPMNCLGHIMIYKSRIRSYRDLPKRYFELGVVHRHEKSGVLNGLLRVREFTQDDAHLFCRPDQLEDEIISVMSFVDRLMSLFGFEYTLELSTRPAKSIGTDENWELATSALLNALRQTGKEYRINEGDGAFYGPKIDAKLTDAIGRSWQCATIQCDFNLPERFDLTYRDENGSMVRPVMIHRVILGSIERFVAILIEHFKGDFPLWISPIQIAVVPVSDNQLSYAKSVAERLQYNGFRVNLYDRDDTLSKKIRACEIEKINYIAVVGKIEAENSSVDLRARKSKRVGKFGIEDLIAYLGREVEHKEN